MVVDLDPADVDFRSLDVPPPADKDGDGVADDVDLDDDNDGILDTDEGFLTLPDGTPISDLLTTGVSTDEVVWNNALAQLLPAGLATLEDFENFSRNTPLNGQQFNGFTVNVSNSQNAGAEYDVDANQYGTTPLSGNRQATIQDNVSAPAGNFADSLITLEITPDNPAVGFGFNIGDIFDSGEDSQLEIRFDNTLVYSAVGDLGSGSTGNVTNNVDGSTGFFGNQMFGFLGYYDPANPITTITVILTATTMASVIL